MTYESIAATTAASIAIVECARILREAGMLDANLIVLDAAEEIMDTTVGKVRKTYGGELPDLLKEQAS